KAPFRKAVQPLFDDFKKDPKQAALLEKFDNAAQ
ncbi:TRAP transporter substrate-binding protein, partial [Shigella flexneri]|nr:TRAP transporter substrate-binding protein [Shigella flexneri]